MKKKVFWIGIEYSYKEDADGYGKLKGGFVYAFIKAHDVRDALESLIEKLSQLKLEPIDIEFVKPYEKEIEWETPKQTKHYLNLYKETNSTNEIVFDDFHAYKHD
jgi:hypothetical protein